MTIIFQNFFCGGFYELETFLCLTHLSLLYWYQPGARFRDAAHAVELRENTIYLK
jgi:hypothetical protein